MTSNDAMEDAATAEVCHAQPCQWSRHRTPMDDVRCIRPALVRELLTGRAGDLFAELVAKSTRPEFLTLAAYQWHF